MCPSALLQNVSRLLWDSFSVCSAFIFKLLFWNVVPNVILCLAYHRLSRIPSFIKAVLNHHRCFGCWLSFDFYNLAPPLGCQWMETYCLVTAKCCVLFVCFVSSCFPMLSTIKIFSMLWTMWKIMSWKTSPFMISYHLCASYSTYWSYTRSTRYYNQNISDFRTKVYSYKLLKIKLNLKSIPWYLFFFSLTLASLVFLASLQGFRQSFFTGEMHSWN